MAARATMGPTSIRRGKATLAAILAALTTLAGCAGWETWPPEAPGQAPPNRDSQAITRSMELALARVIAQAPPRGHDAQPVAFNVPDPLVSPRVYRAMADTIADEPGVNRDVLPLGDDTLDLPIYHVAQVRLRALDAEVDVLRPVFGQGELDRAELANPDAYQGFTVRLRGGVKPWRVTWVTRWSPGIITTPPLNILDQLEQQGLDQQPQTQTPPEPNTQPDTQPQPDQDPAAQEPAAQEPDTQEDPSQAPAQPADTQPDGV